MLDTVCGDRSALCGASVETGHGGNEDGAQVVELTARKLRKLVKVDKSIL